jgi:rRNA maturation endonuclease Nob1
MTSATWNYQCFACSRVFLLLTGDEKKCPSCGGTNGQVVSNERVIEGEKAGVYWNIDPRTGGRPKKKRR